MTKKYSNHAFTLIELAIVILVIAILTIGIYSAADLQSKYKFNLAQGISNNSVVVRSKNLVAWFDATKTDSMGIGNASSVNYSQSIADKSPIYSWKSRDPRIVDSERLVATQSDTNKQPTYMEKSMNGLPSINFTIGNDSSDLNDAINYDYFSFADVMGNSTEFTIYIVYQVNNYILYKQIFVGGGIDIGTSHTNTPGRCVGLIYTNTWYGPWTSNNIKHSTDYPTICTFRYLGGYIQNWMNGIPEPASSTNGAPTNGSGIFSVDYIGNQYNPSKIDNFNGKIGELIIFKEGHSSAKMKNVHDYLAKKWGIKLYQ